MEDFNSDLPPSDPPTDPPLPTSDSDTSSVVCFDDVSDDDGFLGSDGSTVSVNAFVERHISADLGCPFARGDEFIALPSLQDLSLAGPIYETPRARTARVANAAIRDLNYRQSLMQQSWETDEDWARRARKVMERAGTWRL